MIFNRRKTRSGLNCNGRKARKGTSTVELAVCLPVLALIVFGTLQASSMYFLRQALVQSAYETVREVVKADGSQALALERGQQTLRFRNVTGETITFNPANVDGLAPGTPVTVTVVANGDTNSIIPFGVFKGRTVSASASMNKE